MVVIQHVSIRLPADAAQSICHIMILSYSIGPLLPLYQLVVPGICFLHGNGGVSNVTASLLRLPSSETVYNPRRRGHPCETSNRCRERSVGALCLQSIRHPSLATLQVVRWTDTSLFSSHDRPGFDGMPPGTSFRCAGAWAGSRMSGFRTRRRHGRLSVWWNRTRRCHRRRRR